MKKSVSAALPGKIVITSSRANNFGEIDFDNLNLEKGAYWNPLKGYANTKLMVRFPIKIYLLNLYLIININGSNYIYCLLKQEYYYL
jgi:hypothetical protein